MSRKPNIFCSCPTAARPVRIRLPARAADPALRAEATRLLTEIGRTMDPTEPLARVEAAIKMLWDDEAQGTGYVRGFGRRLGRGAARAGPPVHPCRGAGAGR